MRAEVLGILIRHEGADYLVTTDGRYPDLRARHGDGWVSLKAKRWGNAGAVAANMLGTDRGHTQTNLRTLAAEAIAEMVRRLFGGAWGG